MTLALDRRTLIRGATLLPIGLSLANCAQLAQYASDAEVIANGLAGVMPTILSVVGAGTAVADKISSTIAAVKTFAANLASATGNAAVSIATQIQAAVAGLPALISGFTLPPWVGTAIQAAQALAPIILSTLGVALAGAPAMPASMARAILQSAAAQK